MFCTDVERDPANCGTCGRACPTNSICTDGLCQGGGGTYPGLAACMTGGAPVCTNLFTDPRNCGGCGNACPATEGCFGGQCGTQPAPVDCPADARQCPDASGTKLYCANIMYDPQNCGGCGRACAAGMGCNAGQCMTGGGTADGGVATMMCPAGYATCMDPVDPAGKPICANVMYDRNNCGFCGKVCAPSDTCMNGSCVPTSGMPDGGFPAPNCPAYLNTCQPAAAPGYCADFMRDTNNCGGCFNVCPAGFFCDMGGCKPHGGGGADAGTMTGDGGAISCPAPMVGCFPPSMPPYCSDLKYDRYNCGQCGQPCPGGYSCNNGTCMPGATQADGGVGGVVCEPPMSACDGAYCTDFKVDRNNCGGCHIMCKPGDFCNQGVCQLG
jgi:hypothetical protein